MANIPLAVLIDEAATGGVVLGSGAVIDGPTARQLACDASVSRLITGPASEPLDIGRATRSIPVPMSRQLIVEDQHCRWPGCQSPAWSCEGHHVRRWQAPYRGETNLANLTLMCWFHHHLLHKDHGWELELDPNTRRLVVRYRGRLVGTTDPPGRDRRTGPVPAPAPTTTAPGPHPCGQAELFDVAAAADAPPRGHAPDDGPCPSLDVITVPLTPTGLHRATS